jgi:hypothetical protein
MCEFGFLCGEINDADIIDPLTFDNSDNKDNKESPSIVTLLLPLICSFSKVEIFAVQLQCIKVIYLYFIIKSSYY